MVQLLIGINFVCGRLLEIVKCLSLDKYMLGGDFNSILSPSEKGIGIFPPSKVTEGFAASIEDNALNDFIPTNVKFTWKNKRK